MAELMLERVKTCLILLVASFVVPCSPSTCQSRIVVGSHIISALQFPATPTRPWWGSLHGVLFTGSRRARPQLRHRSRESCFDASRRSRGDIMASVSLDPEVR